MLRSALKSGTFLLLATGLLGAQQPNAQPTAAQPTRTGQQAASASRVSTGQTVRSTHAKKAKGKKAIEVAPPQPVVPPPPPTPEQSPAAAPQVTYRGGMLTIVSQNSTLGDILSAVRRLTGAAIDAPSTTLSERIATSLGPAPPKDVLASLFNGSRFNYIILGSMQRPGGIDRIVLTVRQAAGAAPNQVAAQGAPAPRAGVPPQQPEVEPDAEMEDDSAPEREQVEEQPEVEQQGQPEAPPPGQQPNGLPGAVQPGAQPGMQQQLPAEQAAPQAGQQQQNPQQPKSPEQLLRELQELQRQRQNDQQNNEPTNEQPPNDQNPR